jgi:hypothetical protein
MARQIDFDRATSLLAELFSVAEEDFRDSRSIDVPADIVAFTDRLFSSQTAAYREALVGCAVARVLDPLVDIRLPATEYGENAFSGRSLAERVVTPFLRDRRVPVSANPFLSAIRGGARFLAGGAPRIQRDKIGFASLVSVVEFLCEQDVAGAKDYLIYLLRRFIILRERENVPLRRIAKPNLDQLDRLIKGLLGVKSGGRFSAYLATAMFQTLNECYGLGWDVQFQGINVADKASGAVGDITVRKGGSIVLGVEVTERAIDHNRVTMTFDEKISPSGLADYLFVTTAAPADEAVTAARGYTAVGHEINFVRLDSWLVHNLATIGPPCRALFQAKMLDLLSADGVPVELRVAWNDQMRVALGV